MMASKGKLYGSGLEAVARPCSKCGEHQAADQFRPQTRVCRSCEAARARAAFAANPERAKATARARYANDPERILSKQKARNPNRPRDRYHADPAQAKARRLDWAHRNPGKINALHGMRRARKRNACPPWLTDDQRAAMADIYRAARKAGCQTDHIIPLAGCRQCGAFGLHVPWNLQILSGALNQAKRNLCQECWSGGGSASAGSSCGGSPTKVASQR